ncbi:AAA domain-containing protein [Chryseobacterium aquaticum]|uniref:AAA domain-containing protein n=1 Tax=Chryseobacterium aquaticum TaxID=452084 RepID=UPI002FC97579
MKIKDIRQFRTFFKTNIRRTKDTNRDEHFVGTEHYTNDDEEPTFGFFDLYHGQKSKGVVDGIKGFLKGFLDMAQDAQAVYEFLQNAVDANSSHFVMIWGEDETELNEEGKPSEYLLVINNGWQFDFAAIQSILNVGVSTKTEEEHTIGKFGIGFKLAHRLVGKENGLDELLDKNYGPLLFSWKNGELKSLIENHVENISPVLQDYSVSRQNGELKVDLTTEEPWLFKILITNFPTQPDEVIRDAYYTEKNDAFTEADVQKLRKWLSKFKEVIPLEDYNTGSLFFLKLGTDKSNVLDDKNLEEGIRFSLSILNKVADSKVRGLQNVHLNGVDIENAPLEFKSFIVSKDSEEYRYIRFGKKEDLTQNEQNIADKDSDIQFLFGYTDYLNAVELINNVPNFYLFFPLSEEKHNLKFILHSNAFYKKSARTSLHSDALNVRLLEVFGQKVISLLMAYSTSQIKEDFLDFLEIYPLLLLSEESNDTDKQWINEPLIKNIQNYVKYNIPVIASTLSGFEIENDPSKVKIKNTKLELNPSEFGLNYKWFYWGKDELLSSAAFNILNIGQFSILELLYQPGVAQKINNELKANLELLPIIVDEINLLINSVTGSGKDADTFKDNFYELKIFLFDDGELKSINDLNNRASEIKYLLLFEEIEPIKDLLIKAGFVCSKEGLSNSPNIQSFIRLRGAIDYNDYKILNEYLSSGFEKTEFEPQEKFRIFKVLENAKSKERLEDQILRMQSLRLFCNQQGDIVALGSLLKSTEKKWLVPFSISDKENNGILHKYLIETESESYTKVIIPLWETIIADKNGLIRKDIKSFYTDINTLQSLTKQNQTLSNKVFIPLDKSFSANSDSIYFQSGWVSLKSEEYYSLSVFFKNTFDKDLPLYDAVQYLKDAPFNLSNASFDNLTLQVSKEITTKDITVIGKAAHIVNLPLFEKFVIANDSVKFVLRNKNVNEEMVWCDREDIALEKHIAEFHKTLIVSLKVSELKDLIALKESELLDFLIENWDISNEAYTNSFTNVIVAKDDNFKRKFIEKLGTVEYSFEDNCGFTSLNNIVKVALSFSDINTPKKLLQTSLKFAVNAELSFGLSDIVNSGSDTIYFGDENQFHLKLSNIFTTERIGFAKYIETLIEKFTSEYAYDKAKVSQLFNLNITDDKEDILSRIINSINTLGYPSNSSQLAFLLLYKKFINKEFELSKYEIKNKDSTRKLEGALAVSKDDFKLFDEDVYLDEVYLDIRIILKLSEATPSFKVGDFSCYIHPVVENNLLVGPNLKDDLQTNDQIELLDFLIKFHKNSSPLIYHKNWSAIFGFRPELYVSSKYAIKPTESFPDHIYKWSWYEEDNGKKKRKATLLSSLGFHLPWAPINTLREILVDSNSNRTFLISDLNSLPVELLANSLVFIKQNFPDFSFSQNFRYYDLLKEMIKICVQHSQIKIPLPVSAADTNDYNFKDPSIDNVYYYDANKYHELEKLNLDLDELISITRCNIYNALSWTESQELKNVLHDIEIKTENDNDKILEIREEWSDAFYNEWKLKNPNFSLYYYDSLLIKLNLNGTYIKTIKENKYYFSNNCIHCPKKFSFSEIISTLKTTDWISDSAVIELEGLFNDHNMKVGELLSNPHLYESVKVKVDEIKRELEVQVKKNELISNLSTNVYSYKWFESFIELQINQDNESDSRNAEQEISFFSAEWDGNSQRLLNFKDPNRTVTPTIEYCTDFSAIFIFNNRSPIDVKIQDVSKKGQNVSAMLGRPDLLNNVNLKDVKRIDIKFSRSVDLLRRLLNAFRSLNIDLDWQENYDLKASLTHNINFIFGPPGTGKTTLLAERITKIMMDSPDAKILVLTPTNKAADVLTERIIKETVEDDYWLVRYGASFSNNIIERDLLHNKDTFIYESYKKCVCITTIHRLPYEKAILKIEDSENILAELGDMNWDYVIFDEASMIPISYIVYALYKCQSSVVYRPTTFWIAGDPLQIPPVVEIDDEDIPDNFNKEENIYTMVGLNTFNEDEQRQIPIYGENNRIENLTTQYRSIQQIGTLFSEFSYNGDLVHNRATLPDNEKLSRKLPLGFDDLGIQPITLVKFPVNVDDSVYTPGKLRKSAYHIYSAILVLEMIKKFNETLNETEIWTIGIVCPYRSQATLINKMVESLMLKNNLRVITDTVHGFQGDECDMVYFIINPPSASISSSSYGAFIHKHYLINVAISRARDYLIILYPDNKTRGIGNFEKMNIQSEGSIEKILNNRMLINLESVTIHSNEIEEKLFSKKGFIQENSRTNKHQLVNVYNLAEKPYIVRESTTAIDIQFKS